MAKEFIASGLICAMFLMSSKAMCAEKKRTEPEVTRQSSGTPLVIEGSEGAQGVEEWIMRRLDISERGPGVEPKTLEQKTIDWLRSVEILTGISEQGFAIAIAGKLAQAEALEESKP